MVHEQRIMDSSQWVKSLCPYCGVGCGVEIKVEKNKVTKVKGDPDHPSSLGALCIKAVHLNKVVHTPDRLLYPHIRFRRDEPLTRTTWDKVLRFLTTRFKEIIRYYGPDAVAFYGSGQLLTEDYYVFNKFAKGFLGTNNFDTNSRLCMASAVVGYKTSLGEDGPPVSYVDVDLADCFLLIGTNTADCHPVIFQRIEARKKRDPERVKLIVVDPRRNETADIADIFLPIRPGTDIALINALLHVIVREGLEDREFIAQHTEGWEVLREIIQHYSPTYAAEICGVKASWIEKAAWIYGKSSAALTLWSMGLNQSSHGVEKNNAIINLSLATGNMGKPGAGPFSLTGQPNAMGGRETGGLSHLLPGYRCVLNPHHRAEIAKIWGIPAEYISSKPGYSALDLFDVVLEGRVKAIWILATNPIVSMPDIDLAEKALRQAELVVVQDAYYPTDTGQYADVLLPAAQWSEKEGTMTNSERRVTYLAKAVEPPGEALPDWEILCRFAREMGFKDAFNYRCAEEIFEEFKRCTQGTPIDMTGMSYARLKETPLQWPCPGPDHPGTERLYTDHCFPTPDGRARFIPVEHRLPYELPDRDYPLVLITGRIKSQWHTMTRTGQVENLVKLCREPFVEINRSDASRRGIQDGNFVEVSSRRGKIIAQARVTEEICPGTCFIPFHWGRLKGYYKAANNLTVRARDPVSRQPELKFCAVRIRKIEPENLDP